jgi:hypothetical protein
MKFDELYKQLLESFRGEYWYTDGSLYYCDGDVCDDNHERIVIDHILNKNNLFEYSEQIGFEEVTGILFSRDNLKTDEQIQEYSEDYNIDVKTIKDILENASSMTDEDISYLGGRKDAREYGLKNLGWIRIKRNDFQTFHLDNEQLKRVSYAIDEIWEQEDQDYTDEQQETINIEVIKTHKYYTDVPISVVKEGDVGALRIYG